MAFIHPSFEQSGPNVYLLKSTVYRSQNQSHLHANYFTGLYVCNFHKCRKKNINFIKDARKSTELMQRSVQVNCYTNVFWQNSFSRARLFLESVGMSLRHCLQGRSFICNRIGFDAVSPFVYTAPVEFVIRTGSF